MIVSKRLFLSSIAASAAVLSLVAAPGIASANGYNQYAPVTIYFTRHAEKQTEQMDLGDGKFMEICGMDKCAEELNAEGKLRAELMVKWFAERGITNTLTHAISSNKQRTRQTIEMIAADAGLNNDADLLADGVQQLPADGTELNPESTGPSRDLTIEAILNLGGGSVALVAGHSGTLYPIMEGLGLDTSNEIRFPRKSNGKVRDFGDIWKVVLQNGQAQLHWVVKLDATRLTGVWR